MTTAQNQSESFRRKLFFLKIFKKFKQDKWLGQKYGWTFVSSSETNGKDKHHGQDHWKLKHYPFILYTKEY